MEQDVYTPPQADLSEPEYTEKPLASRWARLGGSIIDTIILMLIFIPFAMLTGAWEAMKVNAVPIGTSIGHTIFGVVVYLAINGYLLKHRGQTVGKMILQTRIVSVADDSLLPLKKIVLLRYLPVAILTQIPFVGPIYGLADSLFIFRGDKRCIHDLLAGSKVISLK